MKRKLWLLTLLLSLTPLSPNLTGQSEERIVQSAMVREGTLADQKVNLEVRDATLLRALSTLGIDQDVPIGLELAQSEKYKRQISVEANQAPLRDVLNLIVQQEPNYKWEIRDGTVNFFPVDHRDTFLERLLNTKVARFAPAIGLTKFGIRNAILDLPEVQSALDVGGMVAPRFEYPHRPSNYAKNQVNLSISNTDVRGVLNKVIRESEHNMWVLRRLGENNKTIELSF